MFGLIIPNYKTLSDTDKTEYESVYCGLCQVLKNRFNNLCRLTLNFDFTFLTILLNSLYEPHIKQSNYKCILKHYKPITIKSTIYSEYCADMTILLAFYKLQDDINDNNSTKAKIGLKALNKQFLKVKNKYPDTFKVVDKAMKNINFLEQTACNSQTNTGIGTGGDEISKQFGAILAYIFPPNNDIWRPYLQKIGANLGRFIYFMDAAIDYFDDIKNNSFNPFNYYESLNLKQVSDSYIHQEDFNKNNAPIIEIKNTLCILAGKVFEIFDLLPIDKNKKLLENILLEGMWVNYNSKLLKKEKN